MITAKDQYRAHVIVQLLTSSGLTPAQAQTAIEQKLSEWREEDEFKAN